MLIKKYLTTSAVLFSSLVSAAPYENITTDPLVLASSSGVPKINGYKLQWSDNFSGAKGNLPSPQNWIIDQGTSYTGGPANWGTGEIQTYTNSSTNVALDGNGHLHITPQKDKSGAWTSARIETRRTNFAPPKNGKMIVQARIALPSQTAAKSQGIWPAFWMLGANYRGNYQNWPSVGEFDIMENVNGVNQAFGTLHCGVSPGGPCQETNGLGNSLTPTKGKVQGAFHVYRITLDTTSNPQTLTWSMDGKDFQAVNNNTLGADTWKEGVLNSKFILLNVAVGGGWPGSPNEKTVSGVPMKVDWVAVYYG